jgi:hypothetical protein
METESDYNLPVKRVNGRMWQPGESGNPAGRPIGSLPLKAAQWSISQPTTKAPGININKKPMATYFTGHP